MIGIFNTYMLTQVIFSQLWYYITYLNWSFVRLSIKWSFSYALNQLGMINWKETRFGKCSFCQNGQIHIGVILLLASWSCFLVISVTDVVMGDDWQKKRFVWSEYLKTCNGKAAPSTCFRHVSFQVFCFMWTKIPT